MILIMSDYKFINNNIINLNHSDNKGLKKIFIELFKYIYEMIPLNYDKINQLYCNIKSKMNYVHEEDNDNLNMYIRFYNHDNEDDEYAYTLKKKLYDDYSALTKEIP